MAAVIALMALAVLGLSSDSVHARGLISYSGYFEQQR
jgi:hypothetical protein